MDVDYFFVLAEPTIHTNANNKVVSVTVEYCYMNGDLVAPENFVYQTMVQLNGSNASQICQIGTLWESPEAKTNTELYNFEVQNPFPLAHRIY